MSGRVWHTPADGPRASQSPVGTMASTEEIGEVAAFLYDDRICPVTGATLDANGVSDLR